ANVGEAGGLHRRAGRGTVQIGSVPLLSCHPAARAHESRVSLEGRRRKHGSEPFEGRFHGEAAVLRGSALSASHLRITAALEPRAATAGTAGSCALPLAARGC